MAHFNRGISRALIVVGVAALGSLARAAVTNVRGSFGPWPAAAPGQSATLLAGGEWLLLGGRTGAGRASGQAVLVDSNLEHHEILEQRLNVPRTGQSATVLPDGTVLILGGVGTIGQPVSDAERYYPDTRQFEDLGSIGLPALSGQSATLLTDGELLIAGGTDVSSLVHSSMELVDPTTMTFTSGGKLVEARTGQHAELLPNGEVLIWGGMDQSGRPVAAPELYDPAKEQSTVVDQATFNALLAQDDSPATATVEATSPQAGATGVSVDARLSIRFSKPLNPSTLTDRTVSLFGPAGTVRARVVGAEGGRLAFITPNEELFPGSQYTFFVKGAEDRAGQSVPFTAVGFQTANLTPLALAKPLALQAHYPPPVEPTDDASWIPASRNLTGVWRSGQAPLARQHMPLRASVAWAIYGIKAKSGLPDAAPGVTAVAGQVLQLNGLPLQNVTLSIGQTSVRTGRNGEFLLSRVPSGTQVLVIDGSTADHGPIQYGEYEYRALLEAGKTNALPFVIWMTRLDTADAVTIPSPTTAETDVTNPRIPGLELKIPAGTVIRDSLGAIVTRISMTAIPVDQPPFPLPNHYVPVYFTIQPGGARLESLSSKSAQGAQLIYPNFQHSPPGTRIDFWNYDPTQKGWYVYGQGTVSHDGKQVIPDPGVAIYEFTGAMIALESDAPATGPVPSGCTTGPNAPATAGDPVDCYSGLYVQTRTDLFVRDVIPLEVQRVYRQNDSASRAFGIGTNLSYDIFLVGDTNPWTYQDLVLPDGSKIHFRRTSPGTSYIGADYQSQTPGPFFGATIQYNGGSGSSGYWILTLPNGTVYGFPESENSPVARCAAATSMHDRNGNALTFVRDIYCNLTSITSPNGRSITFTYDSSNRITQATDNSGRAVTYRYATNGNLVKVTDPMGNSESYTYDSSSDLLTVTDKRGNLVLTNAYAGADGSIRVSKQTYADGTWGTFSYYLEYGEYTDLPHVDYANSRGAPTGAIAKRVTFGYGAAGSGLPSGVDFNCTPGGDSFCAEDASYTRDLSTFLATSVTDTLERDTTYQYNSDGNVTQATYLAGTSSAATWNYAYTSAFDEPASITDPQSHTTTYNYDSYGNLTAVVDANGNAEEFGYNSAGQVTSVTKFVNGNPLTTIFSYIGGDLASATDPMGRTTQFSTDAVGRIIGITDPLGNATRITYDALDRITQRTDPLGNNTGYSYDPDGNLLGITDARGNTTSFTYDSMGRVISTTNPLNQTTAYSYDADGNLIQVIDPKGQVSGFTYDLLDRRAGAGFGATTANPTTYLSTIAYTWDQGNRLTQTSDSSSGTITRTYDGLNDLLSEQSPQGLVSYTYYPNTLRKTMTVQGQTPVSYSYDNGNRLTQIEQGSAAVTIGYDSVDRRTSVTLPNGVQMQYGYDNANEVTGITYQNGTTTLGNITYSYDADGRRAGEGGSLARLNLPSAVASASYDAGNRLTSWGGVSLGYDADGNLTSSGASGYTWNERNELVDASDGSSSFAYDAFGRRTTKTVAGTTTTFLNDGANPVLVNSAFMLAGLGMDEYYAQVSSSGTSSLLTDEVGSIVAATDGSGAVTENYAYDPYGATSQSGSGGTPFQFTGRENDGAANLYFYRARYYSPALGRFISQDPAGSAGGPNWYAYVGDDPINHVDPLGLWSVTVEAYAGFGGGVVIGYDEVSGQWFYGGRLGVGVGGGWNLDTDARRPGGPENPGCEHGTTVGGYGSIGVGLPGVFQWNPEEFQGGYEFGTGHDFSEGPAPGPVTFGSPGHFEFGGSVGIQVIGR